jgi:hypothetical protein
MAMRPPTAPVCLAEEIDRLGSVGRGERVVAEGERRAAEHVRAIPQHHLRGATVHQPLHALAMLLRVQI